MPAPPPPNEAARDPCQEEGHLEPSERAPPLLHVVRPRPLPRGRGLTWQERQKTVSCSGSFFYPEMTRRGRRPVGWQPADAGVDFSGLPTDRPVNFDDIEAFELRNAGRVEVFVFVWQQTLWTDGLEYYQQRAPSVREYKCPRCMARFATKASWQRHRATQCYREIAERTGKAPLPGPEKSLLRYRGKASAELAPLTCYADGPHSAAAAGAPERRGLFLLRGRRPMRLRATRGAEAEAHAPRAGQRQVPRRPRHAERPSQAGRPLPHLEAQN